MTRTDQERIRDSALQSPSWSGPISEICCAMGTRPFQQGKWKTFASTIFLPAGKGIIPLFQPSPFRKQNKKTKAAFINGFENCHTRAHGIRNIAGRSTRNTVYPAKDATMLRLPGTSRWFWRFRWQTSLRDYSPGWPLPLPDRWRIAGHARDGL